jgi:coenzyme F420-0:L-glutamate ligase / coenzyme F420-1:gamma-L-glutamate ligase
MQIEQLTSLIQNRRMIRRYTAQAVTQSQIDSILDSAVHAPSPHNRQPWRFAVLAGEARTRLAQRMGATLRADLERDGMPEQKIAEDLARSAARITSAPVAILACMSMIDMDRYADAHRAEAERWMAGQAVAAAIQNMLLTATGLGLGACWMCAPLFCPDVVRAALALPADWEAQALITIGHAADAGKPRARRLAASLAVQIVE